MESRCSSNKSNTAARGGTGTRFPALYLHAVAAGERLGVKPFILALFLLPVPLLLYRTVLFDTK